MKISEIKKISFVIPCYGSEKTISYVIDDIVSVCNGKCDYEIICVNDCSKDNLYEVLCNIAKNNQKVKVINLSKNFGQQNATLCGFRYSKGEVVVTIDDDGQTDPKETIKLIEALDYETDVVIASYKIKKHNSFRNIGTGINTCMSCWLCDRPKNLKMTSFRVIKRHIINEICNYKNPYTYIGGLILRATKNIKNVEVEHKERLSGKSGYTLSKLFDLWLNGFTAFSVKPLRIATITGFISSIIGFLMMIYYIVKKFINPSVLIGYSSIICVLLFIGGMIMLMLGLIGEYIGRIYICINDSPQYVIKDKINIDEEC